MIELILLGNGSGFVGGQPHRAVVDYSYDGTMRSVEQSLLRLGTDRLDLLLIHDVDVWTHGVDAIEDRFREAMAGAYVALDQLRGEGVVAGIGIGVNEAEMCVRFAQAGSFDTMLLAGRYSLLEQPALAKAALSSGCKSHPATAPAGSNRSSHGGNEVAEAFD